MKPDVYELEVPAEIDRLPEVMEFMEQHLEEAECSVKAQMQISVSVEEIFVNIAHYAYAPEKGMAWIRLETDRENKVAKITFTDSGTPFDPLKKADPDVTLSAEERDIGGLGIYMTKKAMDEVSYEYRDGRNNLTLVKTIG